VPTLQCLWPPYNAVFGGSPDGNISQRYNEKIQEQAYESIAKYHAKQKHAHE
jgi:hypothetical protein